VGSLASAQQQQQLLLLLPSGFTAGADCCAAAAAAAAAAQKQCVEGCIDGILVDLVVVQGVCVSTAICVICSMSVLLV
jgi:hypothetical protein